MQHLHRLHWPGTQCKPGLFPRTTKLNRFEENIQKYQCGNKPAEFNQINDMLNLFQCQVTAIRQRLVKERRKQPKWLVNNINNRNIPGDIKEAKCFNIKINKEKVIMQKSKIK